jgi:quinol monooxygenase YgiN
MYGLIRKMTAVTGQRDALAAALLEGTAAMPGCLSYVIANDPADPESLRITEVWDSQASHKALLQLPEVKAAIAKGRPLIAGFSNRVETAPIGGRPVAPLTCTTGSYWLQLSTTRTMRPERSASAGRTSRKRPVLGATS